VSDFKPEEGVAEAAERRERAGGSRWTPIAAAIVAVFAAFTNLQATQRSTQSLMQKNDAIVALTRASDTYNYYQAKATKEEIYKAAILAAKSSNPVLRQTADKENREKGPVLEKAREYDRQAAEANERSEHFLRSQETLEIAVTMLQVAIVVLSISTLASAVFLTVVAAGATVLGVGFAVVGLLP
jgi:hypothetical protein